MKVLSLALAAFLGLSEAKKPMTAKQLKTRMVKGQYNMNTLMRNAKPYSRNGRKLEDGDAKQEEWEITGLYSVVR